MLADIFVSFQDMPDKKIGIALVYAGCKRGASGNPCDECHNPHLWNFEAEAPDVRKKLLFNMTEEEGLSQVDGLVIFGGEPFDQNPAEVIRDIESFKARKPSLEVVVYTGYNSLEEATREWAARNIAESYWNHPLVMAADFIKTGEYRKDLPKKEESSLASENQRMYRVLRRDGLPYELREIEF